MLRFDSFNKLYTVSNEEGYSPESNLCTLMIPKLLPWSSIFVQDSGICLTKEKCYTYSANDLTSFIVHDLQVFREKLFKDCLVIGKFSFVQLDEVKLWRVELCSKPIPKVDITYKNNEIQVIKSYISPEDYRNKVCLKYMF